MLKKNEQWQDGRTPTWLYETLRRLVEGQNQTQLGIGAITRGETPDGTGNPLIDTTKFFYKPGLPGNQLAFGGTAAGGTMTLSSTANSTKGKIYFGTALTTAYDEANDRLGIGTSSPMATLHVVGTSGTVTLLPASDVNNGAHGSGDLVGLTTVGMVSGWSVYSGAGTPLSPPAYTAVNNDDGATRYIADQNVDSGGTNPQVCGLSAVAPTGKGIWTITYTVCWLSAPSAGLKPLKFRLVLSDGNYYESPTIDVQPIGTVFTQFTTTINTTTGGVTAGTPNSIEIFGPSTAAYFLCTYIAASYQAADVARFAQSDGTVGVRIDSSTLMGVGTGTTTLTALQTIGLSTTNASVVRQSVLGHTAQTVDMVQFTPGIAGTTAMIWNLRGTLSAGRIGTGVRFTDDNAAPASAKLLALSLTSITAGQTRTWTAQDASGTVAFISPILDGVNNTDTLAGTVVRGDLIVGNSTPKWARFALGANGTVLFSNGTDPSWTSIASLIDQARTWTTLQKFPDDKFQIIGSVDPTKIAQFEADSLPIGTNIFTFPNYGGGGIIPAPSGYGLPSGNGLTTEGQILRSNGTGVAPSWGNAAFLDSLGSAAEMLTIGSAANAVDLIRFRIDCSGTNTLVVPLFFGASHTQTLSLISLDQTWSGIQSFPQSKFEIIGVIGPLKKLQFKVDDSIGNRVTVVQSVASGNRTITWPDVNSSIMGYKSETDGQPPAGELVYGRGASASTTSLVIGAVGKILVSDGTNPTWSNTIAPASGTALIVTPPSGGAQALVTSYTDTASNGSATNGVWALSPTISDAAVGVGSNTFLRVAPVVSDIADSNQNGVLVSVSGTTSASLGTGAGSLQGLQFTVGPTGSGGTGFGSVIGVTGSISHQATDTITSADGARLSFASGTSKGTVTDLSMFRVSAVSVGTSTTVTNVYLFRGINPTGGGTLTTLYGLFLPSLTKGGTNWAIMSQGGQSAHAGNLKLGATTAPATALDFADAKDITFGTTTGTKIGAATSQKLAFWNAAPIVQPTTGVGAATRVGGGGAALTDTDTFDGYTLAQMAKALRNIGLLA
jgi:hypothetical protein